MESLFEEIFSIEGILGALLMAEDGVSQFSKFVPPLSDKIRNKNFDEFVKKSINIESLRGAFDTATESLLIYDHIRLYVRRIKSGYLIVAMGMFVPVAMVRLNCQIIIAELDKMKSNKGLGRFFKK